SQCLDEDCTSSKLLADDNFTITKNKDSYSSGPKSAVEISLDPNYGDNCIPDTKTASKAATVKNHAQDTALEIRIADAVNLIESVPTSMQGTRNILLLMQDVAIDAATNSH